LSALLVAGVALAIAGCTKTSVDSIAVSPATQSVSVGQTAQFTATGIIDHGSHPASTEDVTSMVTWKSSSPAIATVNSAGMVTAVAVGTATITATLAGATPSTGSITVTPSTGGSAGGDVISVNVIPGTQSVLTPTQTSQFIAIGTTSSGATENVSSQVSWSSSSAQIATINPSGLATAVGQGTSTITALLTNADKTVATGTSSFTVQGPIQEQITKLSITPTQQSLSASGQTSQFIALGTSGTTGLVVNVTSMTGNPGIVWTSSVPTVASVNSTGLVAGQSPGQCTVTAVWTNADGTGASASAIVNVTSSPAPEPLLSLTIIPNTITVGNLQDTGNFLAIGTFSTSPTVRDLTNSVTWLSSFPSVFPVNTNSGSTNPGAPAGVVTAYGTGGATIIAEATDPSTGSIQTATATFNCPLVLPTPTTAGSCYPGSQAAALLSTITVYNEGLNTANWLVTAPSSTGTPNVIHCGPGWTGSGGSVCVATYPMGTTVTLTAPAQAGVAFGGWSINCTPNPNPPTEAGPNQCSMTLTGENTNVTVGAIFN